MKFSSTIADIRQLCCMGLDGATIMPALFEYVQKIVPSHFQVFLWADRNYEVSNMFTPDMPSVAKIAQLYLDEFANKKEKEVKPAFSEIMRSVRGTVRWERFQTRRFFRSDFFNLVLRPLEARHMLGTVVHDRDRALGELMLWRAPRERPYSEREAQILAGLIPYIAHAIAVRPRNRQQFTETGERGLAIVNRKGEIEYACSQAHRLLFWATHPEISRATLHRLNRPSMPPTVAKLASTLSNAARGAPAFPPVLHHENSWGRFTFRVYRLDQTQSHGNELFGVSVEREEPLMLALWSRMRIYGLSLRQKEVCQSLVLGSTYLEIAEQLSIRPHTVVDHVRTLYEKLNVHTRAELVNKLSADTDPKKKPR